MVGTIGKLSSRASNTVDAVFTISDRKVSKNRSEYRLSLKRISLPIHTIKVWALILIFFTYMHFSKMVDLEQKWDTVERTLRNLFTIKDWPYPNPDLPLLEKSKKIILNTFTVQQIVLSGFTFD